MNEKEYQEILKMLQDNAKNQYGYTGPLVGMTEGMSYEDHIDALENQINDLQRSKKVEVYGGNKKAPNNMATMPALPTMGGEKEPIEYNINMLDTTPTLNKKGMMMTKQFRDGGTLDQNISTYGSAIPGFLSAFAEKGAYDTRVGMEKPSMKQMLDFRGAQVGSQFGLPGLAVGAGIDVAKNLVAMKNQARAYDTARAKTDFNQERADQQMEREPDYTGLTMSGRYGMSTNPYSKYMGGGMVPNYGYGSKKMMDNGGKDKFEKYLAKKNIPFWLADNMIRRVDKKHFIPADSRTGMSTFQDSNDYRSHDYIRVANPNPLMPRGTDEISNSLKENQKGFIGSTSNHFEGVDDGMLLNSNDRYYENAMLNNQYPMQHSTKKVNPWIFNTAEPGDFYDEALSNLKAYKKIDKKLNKNNQYGYGGKSYKDGGMVDSGDPTDPPKLYREFYKSKRAYNEALRAQKAGQDYEINPLVEPVMGSYALDTGNYDLGIRGRLMTASSPGQPGITPQEYFQPLIDDVKKKQYNKAMNALPTQYRKPMKNPYEPKYSDQFYNRAAPNVPPTGTEKATGLYKRNFRPKR